MSTASYLYSGCQLAQLALIYTESTQPEKIKTVHRTTLLFLSLSTTFLLWNTFHPAAGITKKQSWLLLAASGTGAGLAYRSSGLPDEIDLNNLVLSDRAKQTCKAYYRTPQSQRLPQALLVAQTVHALGSLLFGELQNILPDPLVANAAALFLSRRLRILKVNYKHETPIKITVSGLPDRTNILLHQLFGRPLPIPTYTRSLTPELVYQTFVPARGVVQAAEGECPLCLESPGDFSFCSQSHPVCKPCFIAHCIASIDRLGHKDKLLAVTAYFNQGFGQTKFSHFKYKILLGKEDLPICPTCRSESVSHSLPQFKIEFKQGTIEKIDEHLGDDTPEALPDPGFWSGVFCGFTAVQLVLACAHYTHPHLAGPLYKIQKLMLPLDALFLGGLVLAEQAQMTKKPYARRKTAAKVAAVASVLLAVGLALYRWKETPPSLTHHLKGIVSDETLAQIKLTSLQPTSLSFMQWSFGTRMFALLALASFSPNRRNLIAAAALSALTLLKLSTISWICIERKYADLHWAASSVTTRLHFTIPNPSLMTPTTEGLQHTIKTLCDYSENFFKESKWDAYWRVTKRNGFEIGRVLVFDVTASPKALPFNGYDLSNLLVDWGGSVTSSVRPQGWYFLKPTYRLYLSIEGKSFFDPLL